MYRWGGVGLVSVNERKRDKRAGVVGFARLPVAENLLGASLPRVWTARDFR
jgi:hypothetical protein